MGLERISALLQGTHDNYETDHFKTLIKISSDLTKTKITKENIASHRVIADHLRASAFLIAEGVLPSNEGRGVCFEENNAPRDETFTYFG